MFYIQCQKYLSPGITVDICRDECIFRDGITCDHEMFELLITYMVRFEFGPPTSPNEGIYLYRALRPLVIHDLLG